MNAKVDISSTKDPLIVITRVFDAPREDVWTAITDPKHVAQWYGGQGFTNPVCEMDLRPGGAWHQVMQAPNGMQFRIESVFEEVTPPERLVWRTQGDPKRNPAPPTSHNTVTLTSRGTQTEWMLVARFDSFADRDLTAQMGFGRTISAGLDRLENHLKTL